MALMDIAFIDVGSSGDFVVSTGSAAILQFDNLAGLSLSAPELYIDTVRQETITMPIVGLTMEPSTLSVKTTIRKIIEKIIPPKRAWQARLGSRLDNIYIKSIDNKLSLASYPIDMVRVKVTRDPKTQDLISRTVVGNEIIPIYFEAPLKDLPFRRLEYEDTENIILTIDGTKLTDIRVKCPIALTLARGDLLFRILRDNYSERPVVLVLQVKDELATVGYSKLIQVDYVLSYYDEKLPESIITAVIDSVEKREEVQW